MERGDRAPVATFFAPELGAVAEDGTVTLGEAVAHHARVKRLEVGDPLRLTDGRGTLAQARIQSIGRRSLEAAVDVQSIVRVDPPSPVTLLVPVADRERMLWLAEKCTELSLTHWRPVVYQRSRSVAPRGEGEAFREKVRARMTAALEQSGGAWLPECDEERPAREVLEAAASWPGERWLLDPAGAPPAAEGGDGPLTIAAGPEGGLEPEERERFVGTGWRLVSLAPTILRFETAALSALAVARAVRGRSSADAPLRTA